MGSVSIRDSINHVINITDPQAIIYANINKVVQGVYSSPTTVIFNSGWAIAPDTITPTTIDSFTFFVNGQNIEKQAIASFVDGGTNSTLVIDPDILQFSFDESDVVLGVGKFN